MDRWSGRSSTGECPCVLPVLLIAVVVVVDGRLGPVVRQRVLAVAIAAAVTGGGALLGDLDGRVVVGLRRLSRGLRGVLALAPCDRSGEVGGVDKHLRGHGCLRGGGEPPGR